VYNVLEVKKGKRKEKSKMLKDGAECLLEYKEDVLYATLVGEIDHHSAQPLRETIDREMVKYRPKLLCIDLGRVGFMDSSGLGLILGRSAMAQELGACVRLCRVDERTMKILNMAGVERVVGISIEGVNKKGGKKK
jgi:stage II sporulation protein AA (anti-sigma F factor antagonist)